MMSSMNKTRIKIIKELMSILPDSCLIMIGIFYAGASTRETGICLIAGKWYTLM